MLVLTRKAQEAVVVGRAEGGTLMLTVTVLEINGGKVRLGFDGDASFPVHRAEVWERIRAAAQPASVPQSPPASRGALDRWDNEGGGAAPMVRRPAEALACNLSTYDLKESAGAEVATSSHGRDGCPAEGTEAIDQHE